MHPTEQDAAAIQARACLVWYGKGGPDPRKHGDRGLGWENAITYGRFATAGLLAVLFGVHLARILMVVGCVQMMAMSDLRMMRRFLMVAGLVVMSGFAMVFRSFGVVVSGLLVVFVDIMLGHGDLPAFAIEDHGG
jgi:hypothetical protein